MPILFSKFIGGILSDFEIYQLVLSLYVCVIRTGSSEMRFINKNQHVNSASLHAVNGAGSMVSRVYQTLWLRLERFCTGLFRAPNQRQLWPLTATEGRNVGIEHRRMYLSALGDTDCGLTLAANSGKPATGISYSQSGTGLS